MLSFIPIITSTDNKGHLKLGSMLWANCPTGFLFYLLAYVHFVLFCVGINCDMVWRRQVLWRRGQFSGA